MDIQWSSDEDGLDDVDLDIDLEMPETPVGQRSGRGRFPLRSGAGVGNKNDTKVKKGGRVGSATYMNTEDTPEENNVKAEVEQDPQEKLCHSLKNLLTECSSQRLRSLHMTLRRLANVDNRISEKDVQQAFQESQINLTSRLNQRLSDLFGTPQGIDYERLYKCIVTAHNLTDRDSVKARRKRNDLSSRAPLSQEKRDADFLSRIEAQLIRDQTFFDIDMLRGEFQNADSHRSGKIRREQMGLICSEKTPLYGALLVNLLKRCDEDKNDTVSWPTLLSFLERGQNNAREKDPELRLLPEKARATAAVNVAPDPLSELSSGTKARLMSKLMKRASSRSSGSRAGSAMSNAPSVATTNSSRDPSPDPAVQTKGGDSETNDTSDKTVSFLPKPQVVRDTPPPDSKDQSNKSAKEEGKGRSPSPSGRRLFSGMKRLLSGGKKRETAGEGGGEGGGGEKSGGENPPGPKKEVPLIEVDKASESDPSVHEQDVRASTGQQQQPASSSNATITTTTTTTTTPTTTTTTSATASTTTTNNNNAMTDSAAANVDTSARKDGGKGKEEEEGGQGTGGKVHPRVKGVELTLPKDYKPPDIPVDPPNERLQLDWVYGCRGNDCRRTIQSLGSGELVYFISNICVLLDRSANGQRHYREHTEDIKCLAVHSNSMLVASGQFASKLHPEHVAHIRVWRSDLLQTTHVLGAGAFSKAVMCLAFMPNKDLLAAVDNAPDKHLTVWDLDTKETVADNYFNTDTVCDLEFNPKYPDLLVTCGKEHMQWWRLYPETKELQPFSQPDYEQRVSQVTTWSFQSYLRAKYVVCSVHTDKGDLITGDSNGTMYIWGDGGNKIANFVKHGHEGPVLSVMYYKGYLLSGGRDGAVSAWSWGRNMDNAATVKIPVSEGGVRGLMVKDGMLIVCTTMNSVLSITLNATPGSCPLADVSMDPVPITQGHFDELRAVTVIPESFLGADILTAGSDGVLCKFDTKTHAPVWKLYMKGKEYLCVDCSRTGELLILGTRDGRVVGLQINTENMMVMEVLNKKVTTSSILCITLCPDENWFAAGGQDGAIYVFRMREQQGEEEEEEGGGEPTAWNVWGIMKGHTGQVVSLDWSLQPFSEGTFLLRSCSSAPQQKFWDVNDHTEMNGSELPSVTWASNTSILDHLLTGVWGSKQAEHAQIITVDVNPGNSLVAMGNSQGLLSLYRYPCVKDLVYSHTYQAHQVVRRLRFSPSGLHIVTAGGHDSAILQWTLI